MKKLLILFTLMSLFLCCSDNKEQRINEEKQEIDVFVQKWIGFVASTSMYKFKDIFVNNNDLLYSPIENDDIMKGYENIEKYWKAKIADFDLVDYNLWEKNIYVSDDYNNAMLTFKANKKIKLKNGYIVEFKNVKTSIYLIKTIGKWKVLSLFESVKIR